MAIKYRYQIGNVINAVLNESDVPLGATYEIINTEDALPVIIPQSVTPRQFRVALIMSNISMQSIEDMIAALPEPDQSIVRTTWEYSTVFERDNTILNNMAANMGLTQQEVDNLFILAEDL